MIVVVKFSQSSARIEVNDFDTGATLQEMVRKSLPDLPPTFWLTFQGLVLADDTVLDELSLSDEAEILCSASLLCSVTIPTTKGIEVRKVAVQNAKNRGNECAGNIVNGSSSSPPTPYSMIPSARPFLSLDIGILLSTAGMFYSFWYLTHSLSSELNSFKENKSFSDIAKSMVSGSIEGLLENIQTVRKLIPGNFSNFSS